ncbi:hypothetical protein BK011_04550 [Tenericutes bacterium MZ-XQ]|jgi:ubiquinone/menaquinone biosynthesis C-methylase UbiE|nr:hypothetical protein BK011_04550 [Tenericutes bacterium MZ-XQ]
MDHKQTSISFWDQFFKDYKPVKIEKEDIVVSSKLDEYLKQIGDYAEHILDVGCGTGYALIGSKCLGTKMKSGIGFDSSHHAIHIANETVRLSNIEHLSFEVSDETFLKTMPDESFDGIICSNFLDVIPKQMSDDIIDDIERVLKKDGLFLLKINFPLDEHLIKKMNMEEIEENTYQLNGVVRAYNLTTEQWIKRFKHLQAIQIDGFKRAEHLPEDRIILFQKK